MFHIAQRDSSAGALCCREKYYSATSSIVLGKYGIKYKCYPLISEKVKFKQNTISFFVFLCQTMIKRLIISHVKTFFLELKIKCCF